MFDHRHPHSELMLKIDSIGEVPCERLPEIFFPEDISDPEVRTKATATAKAICKTCPLQTECAEYAVTTRQEFGVWGGILMSHLTNPD